MHAAGHQGLDVLLRGGVFPHAGVHRGGDQHGGLRRHDGGREHIIRDAAGHLADDIRRCRRDQKQVRALGQRDMLDLPCLRALKCIHGNRMTGQRLKRQRRDKPACMLRHDHIHIQALLLQQTKQLTCLISSDAPGDAEDNAHILLT